MSNFVFYSFIRVFRVFLFRPRSRARVHSFPFNIHSLLFSKPSKGARRDGPVTHSFDGSQPRKKAPRVFFSSNVHASLLKRRLATSDAPDADATVDEPPDCGVNHTDRPSPLFVVRRARASSRDHVDDAGRVHRGVWSDRRRVVRDGLLYDCGMGTRARGVLAADGVDSSRVWVDFALRPVFWAHPRVDVAGPGWIGDHRRGRGRG